MKKRLLHTLTAFTLALTLLLFFLPEFLFGQAPPNLGVANTFVLFSSNGAVTHVGAGMGSHITGNVGSDIGGPSSGFGNVDGQMLDGGLVTSAAASDLNTAYLDINSQSPATPHGNLFGGETLSPGIVSVAGISSLGGILTLDGNGDTNAYFLFQLNGPFSTNASAQVVLINGAQACNVFWKVEGAVNLAAGTIMRGNIIANNGAISIATGSTLEGRALSTTGAVSVNTGLTAFTPIGCGSPYLKGPLSPNIGSLACYALLTTTGPVTNTGITHIIGDIGTNGGGTVTGYNPLFITGMIHSTPDGSTAQGSLDLNILFNYLNTLPVDIELLYPADFGHSLVLTPHVYLMNSAVHLTDTIFLNGQGNPNAVFVIKFNGALTTGTYSNVVLQNGTKSGNVFWLANNGLVDISGYSNFRGTIVANNGAITLNGGDTLDGRALSTTGAINTHDVYVAINTVPPTITPLGLTTFCQGDSLIFTASGGASYLWSTGDTTQSITVYTENTYSVSVIGGLCNINGNASIVVNVDSSYVINLDTSICSGDSLFLAGAFRTMAGIYSDTLSTIAGCDSIIHTDLEVNSYYIVNLDTSICSGDSLFLAGAFRTMAGIYSDTLSTIAGCDSIIVIRLILKDNPMAVIAPDGPITFCEGGSVILTASDGSSYLWSTGATTQSLTVINSGNYSVIITNLSGCIRSSILTEVTVNPLPIVTITPDGPTTFCERDSVILTASLGISYLWSTGATTQQITLSNSGNYSVEVTDLQGCIDESALINITINPLPIAEFTFSEIGLFTYSFDNISENADSSLWRFGDGETSSLTNPAHTYTTPGTYSVRLIVTNGCGADDFIEIIKLQELEFFNGFSPNSDGYNDYWRIPILSYYIDNSVLIINRWGSEIWMGVNYDNELVKWTGENMNGIEIPDGTYYYIITYNNTEKRGWVYVKR